MKTFQHKSGILVVPDGMKTDCRIMAAAKVALVGCEDEALGQSALDHLAERAARLGANALVCAGELEGFAYGVPALVASYGHAENHDVGTFSEQVRFLDDEFAALVSELQYADECRAMREKALEHIEEIAAASKTRDGTMAFYANVVFRE